MVHKDMPVLSLIISLTTEVEQSKCIYRPSDQHS